MPLQKLQYRPGVNRESTSYANEGGFFACDKVRFRSGYPEKIGGWIRQSIYTFNGVARSLWNWVTLSGENLLGVGTNQKFYVEEGGQYNDITPLVSTASLGADPFETTTGSLAVEVTDTGHGTTVGSFVTFAGATTFNGVTIDGEYEIVTVIDGNTYIIISATAASGSGTGGGGAVTAEYQLPAGNSVYTTGTGWGAGGWGRGGWGSGTTVGVGQQLRLWSQDNYGQDLVLAPRGGEIYYWEKDTSTYARAILLEDAANAVTQWTTTGTSGGAGTTITVAEAGPITAGCVVAGTNVPAGTYVTTAYVPGSTSVTLSASTTGAASGSYTFSYAGRFVPNTTNRIMVSAVNRFLLAFGANPYDPTDFATTFDPMLVRWSDQDNVYQWVPTAANQSGEQRLSHGSYIVTAQITRQEVLVWTDAAIYSMQYLGPPFVWGVQLLMDGISIASPNSAISISNVTYWMGADKFYQYSGRVETLPCTLRQYVFGDINKSQMQQIVCGTNEGYNEVWWHYPSASSQVNDRYIVYNYLERIWYYGTLNRTAWLDSPLRQYPMAAFSVQTSYLSADIDSSVDSITLLDGTAYPSAGTVVIDSEEITYTGVTGSTLTGCVRGANGTGATTHEAYTAVPLLANNQIMFHEYGVDDQSTATPEAIAAYIESSDFDIGDGHNFGFVWRMLPDLTFDGSTTANPSVVLTVKPRQNSGANYGTADSPTVTRTATYPVEQYTGQVYTRIRGRQMAFRIDSTDVGVTWQLGVPRIDIRPDGRR